MIIYTFSCIICRKVSYMRHYLINILYLILACSLLVSCKSVPQLLTMEMLPSSTLEPSEILLKPGDEIEVKYRYWPELDETQTIRTDGNISLQLVDDVKAAGLTPAQLDDRLTKLYEGKIKDPVITVIVSTSIDRRVYVSGEVLSPGVIPYNDRLTVLEAIMTAGGFDVQSAELSNVLVIRHKDDKRYIASLDIENIFKKNESESHYLAKNDIVFVPRTRVVELNQWLDQHITQLIPNTPIQATFTKTNLNTGHQIGLRSGGR